MFTKMILVSEKKVEALTPVFHKDPAINKSVKESILPKSKARFLGAVGPTIRGSA